MEEYFCPLGKDFGGGRVCLFFLPGVEEASWLMQSVSIF